METEPDILLFQETGLRPHLLSHARIVDADPLVTENGMLAGIDDKAGGYHSCHSCHRRSRPEGNTDVSLAYCPPELFFPRNSFAGHWRKMRASSGGGLFLAHFFVYKLVGSLYLPKVSVLEGASYTGKSRVPRFFARAVKSNFLSPVKTNANLVASRTRLPIGLQSGLDGHRTANLAGLCAPLFHRHPGPGRFLCYQHDDMRLLPMGNGLDVHGFAGVHSENGRVSETAVVLLLAGFDVHVSRLRRPVYVS